MIWESKILYFLQTTIRTDTMDKFMVFVSSLANGGLIFIISCVAMLFLPNMTKTAYMSMTSFTVNALATNIILKPIIARIRPFEKYSFITSILSKLPQDYSFPSGHTSSSFAFATSVFFYNKPLGILAYIYAALVAFSRMYLGVHYPTDVVAGIFVGTAIAILCQRYSFVFYQKLSEML